MTTHTFTHFNNDGLYLKMGDHAHYDSALDEVFDLADDFVNDPAPVSISNTALPQSSADLGASSYLTRQFTRLSQMARQRNRDNQSVAASSSSSSSNSSNATVLNPPVTAESAPTPSNKRKVSSSAISGKSPTSPRAPEAGYPIYEQAVTIQTKDLFPGSERARPVSYDGNSDWLDDEDIEYALLNQDDVTSALLLQAASMRQRTNSSSDAQNRTVARMKAAFGAIERGCPPRLSIALISTQGSHGSSQVKYLPLCATPQKGRKGSDSELAILPSHRVRIDKLANANSSSSARLAWPTDSLPVEIFELINEHLARDDVKSMRLVNRDFERKVSRSLFHTCVVPFNTELYDMIDEEAKTTTRQASSRPMYLDKGKGRATEPSDTTGAQSLYWQNATEDKEDKVYKGHGLRVFRGFGPHIKRFGMSFEVSEKQLSNPPAKKGLDHIDSYHGVYDWPPVVYARFAGLAGLESTADETARMKDAFANLQNVQELALSVDSGLGWLTGPDKSVRSRIFARPTPIFGSTRATPDHQAQAAQTFRDSLQHSQSMLHHDLDPREIQLASRPFGTSADDLSGLRYTRYADPGLWASIDAEKAFPDGPSSEASLSVLYTTPGLKGLVPSVELQNRASNHVRPGGLSKAQKEWLLETEWAQRAFLESWRLAVIDNWDVFENVTTINLAKLSSSFLPIVGNAALWEALPSVNKVVLHIKPDWRTVQRDDAGIPTTETVMPSATVRDYHLILCNQIAKITTIKTLDIGYVGGGERAEGMYARNQHVLPAPITRLEESTRPSEPHVVVFKHVERLTLTNCYISPLVLEGLVAGHADQMLKVLTLDSVSLTAHPRFRGGQAGIVGLGGTIAFPIAPVNQAIAGAPHGNPGQAQHMHGQIQHQLGQIQQMQQNMLNPVPPQTFTAQQVQQMHQTVHTQMTHVAHMQQLLAGLQHPGPQQAAPGIWTPPGGNAPPQPASHWTEQHRDGSWPHLLSIISPGPILADYQPAPAPWEKQRPDRPETTLFTIELKSCGYAKVDLNTVLDQSTIDPDLAHSHTLTPWFRVRLSSLRSAMLETKDLYHASIVQYMSIREAQALQFAWGLQQGWPDDRDGAEAVEHDGHFPGGTGRFSGIIRKGMPLVGQEAINSGNEGQL